MRVIKFIVFSAAFVLAGCSSQYSIDHRAAATMPKSVALDFLKKYEVTTTEPGDFSPRGCTINSDSVYMPRRDESYRYDQVYVTTVGMGGIYTANLCPLSVIDGLGKCGSYAKPGCRLIQTNYQEDFDKALTAVVALGAKAE